MDRIRDIFLYFVAALAMFSLLCAIYQAMNDKNVSAGTLGGIFLVSALIVFIPQLEVLKAWRVEAKLKQSLDRAEEIIGRLKQLSVLSAKATYITMTWENRLGSPSAKDKQQLLDEVDKQLESLDVSPAERAAVVGPFVQYIAVDYWNIFARVIDRYIEWKRTELAKVVLSQSTGTNRADLQHLSDNQSHWRSSTFVPDQVQRIKKNGLLPELERVIPDWLSPEEKGKLEGLKTEIVQLFDDCEKKGGYTPEGAEFYDRYSDIGGWDRKIKELFGFNPSDVK
jgi:hypothetical protein